MCVCLGGWGVGRWARQSKVYIDLTILLSKPRREDCLFCVYHVSNPLFVEEKKRDSENVWCRTLGYEFVC